MRPAGLATVCNDIVLSGRRRIVELGSGISTVLLARLLCQRWPPGGFRIAAVEHDARWAQWVTEQLDREGTGADVVVVHALLAPHPEAEGDLTWYDAAALTAAGWRATPPYPFSMTGWPPARPWSSMMSSGPASRRSCDGGSTRPGSTSTVEPTRPG